MTIDEKRDALDAFCDSHSFCEDCVLYIPELKCGRGQHFNCVKEERVSDSDVNLAYSIAFPDAEGTSEFQEAMEKNQECCIKDSGSRREFDTGAVRDIQEGKGRCDLLPLDVVAEHLLDDVVGIINLFKNHGTVGYLFSALSVFQRHISVDNATMVLEVSKHFEEGAKKYGEDNWQKGIPTHCYIDSAIRHYLKWLRGDKDEPHGRAFCWNILCCIWTCMHKPELNDYRKDGE